MSSSTSSNAARFVRDLRTIPNLLSLSRIVLTPLALISLSGAGPAWALWLLLASAIVDILDGYLARRLDQCTALGAILDRATDLMMESVALFILVAQGVVPAWALFVYLFREFIVTSARMYMAQIGATIPKSSLGQRKTNFLMAGFCLLYNAHAAIVPLGPAMEASRFLGLIGVWGGLGLSFLSMLQYLRALADEYESA